MNSQISSLETQVIKFSSKAIAFTKQNNFVLEITNKNQTQSLAFKIKTTKLNTYEVKPPIGSIQPNEKKQIEFKLVKPLTNEEIEESRARDKFQLQFLIAPANSVPKNKPEFKTFWDAAKNDPSKEGSFCNFTFPVAFEGYEISKASGGIDLPSPSKSKSLISVDKGSNIKKSFTFQGDASATQNDQQLSKEFQRLKEQEQKLLVERQNIFKSQPKATSKSKGSSQIIICIQFSQHSYNSFPVVSHGGQFFETTSICRRSTLILNSFIFLLSILLAIVIEKFGS